MRLTGIPRASNAPRMARVKQQFSGPMLQDIHAAVRQTLGSLPLPIKPGQTVALAVGSRGIVNIDVVAKAAVDHVKALGAKPFIFPAMGSHGGGTAEGQRSVLEHYGVTEATMGCPVRARIAFGLGIVENGYDETAVVQAFLPPDMEAGERELLRRAKSWMARLPFEQIDLLIVDEMGKDISGSGMDSNIIGRHGTFFEPPYTSPKVTFIVVGDLTAHTYGNAIGLGSADFVTRRLVDKIDWEATYVNGLTACSPAGCKMPATLDSTQEAISIALSCLGLDRVEDARVVRIKNTLQIAEVDVSECLLPEVAKRDDLSQVGDATPLAYDPAGYLLPF